MLLDQHRALIAVSYCFTAITNSGSSKQWNLEVKMNTAVRSHCFLDDTTLATSGVDADVYIWDLRKTGRCVARYGADCLYVWRI